MDSDKVAWDDYHKSQWLDMVAGFEGFCSKDDSLLKMIVRLKLEKAPDCARKLELARSLILEVSGACRSNFDEEVPK